MELESTALDHSARPTWGIDRDAWGMRKCEAEFPVIDILVQDCASAGIYLIATDHPLENHNCV